VAPPRRNAISVALLVAALAAAAMAVPRILERLGFQDVSWAPEPPLAPADDAARDAGASR
jgi:hypothetical protein